MATSHQQAELEILLGPSAQWPDYHNYQSLNQAKHEIRLLHIQYAPATRDLCASIVHSSLDTKTPEYEALSYCWGPPGLLKEIDVGGEKVKIRASLHSFLDTLCYLGQRRPIWVDSICINQRDVNERDQQVSMMGRIYQQAKCVKSWLGNSDMYSDFALIYAAHYETDPVRGSTQFESIQRQARESFLHLLSRPYWQRLWIVQEIGLSKHLVLFCGQRYIGWKYFVAVVQYLSPIAQHDLEARDPRSIISMYAHQFQTTIQPLANLRMSRNRAQPTNVLVAPRSRDGTGRFQRGSLLYWVRKFGHCQSEDLRDKLFGLRSIANDADLLNIDYSKSLADLVLHTMLSYRSRYPVTTNVEERSIEADLRKIMDVCTTDKQAWLNIMKTAKLNNPNDGLLMDFRIRPQSSGKQLTDYRFYNNIDRVILQSGYEEQNIERAFNLDLVIDSYGSRSGLFRIDELKIYIQGTSFRQDTQYQRSVVYQLLKLGEIFICVKHFKVPEKHYHTSFHCSPAAILLIALFEDEIDERYLWRMASMLAALRKRSPLTRLCHCAPFSAEEVRDLMKFDFCGLTGSGDTTERYWQIVGESRANDFRQWHSLPHEVSAPAWKH